jgi:DNA-directed RNA polymerase specialized sigma24 family protein
VETFEAYVRARGSALLRLAHLLTGDQQRAEELVEEALGRAYRRWSRVRSAADADAYVRRVLLHGQLPHRRPFRRSERPTGPAGPEAVVGADVTGAGLTAADDIFGPVGPPAETDRAWQRLGELPTRQRAVLVLRYWAELPDIEIAELLRCGEASVRSAGMRGLSYLGPARVADDREAST